MGDGRHADCSKLVVLSIQVVGNLTAMLGADGCFNTLAQVPGHGFLRKQAGVGHAAGHQEHLQPVQR